MIFEYFENPRDFAYMAESGHTCHFCKATDNCLDGAHFFGQDEIDAICFSCMQAGCLIDLDISTNEIDISALDPNLVHIEQVSNEIIYCTPSVPTWQGSFWPIKNGRPYRFIKIASKLDYESKKQFIDSLFENSNDPEWLWSILPDHKISNIKEGQYDLSCYLFEFEGDKLTTWDAS
jgi:uncharacterized protein CbrC (UPF0167 family)